MSRTIEVTVEWALYGKDGYDRSRVLAFSEGGFYGAEQFNEVMDRFTIGSPETLPQVTIAWASLGQEARVFLIIHEWADGADLVGRPKANARLFAVRYTDLAKGPVSYEDMYRAFLNLRPALDGPVEVELPVLDPQRIGQRITRHSMDTAALLLTQRSVCVLDTNELPLERRLRHLDEVAFLLPYGMRARLSASTWTSSTATHRIRFSFSQAPRQDSLNVEWGRYAGLPDREEVPRKYRELLGSYEHHDSLVATLAAATEPMDFSQPAETIATVDGTIRPPSGQPTTATRELIERVLRRCASALLARDSEEVSQCLNELMFFKSFLQTAEQRAEYRQIMLDLKMLAPTPGLEERVRAELYLVLLGLAVGPALSSAAIEDLRATAGGRLHSDLILAMLKIPEGQENEFRFDQHLTPPELTEALAHMPPYELVEMAARHMTDKNLFLATCKALKDRAGVRGPAYAGGATVANALLRHGYLAKAIQWHFPGSPEIQHRLFTDLLRAAYGDAFGPVEFEGVLVSGGAMPPAALLSAVIDVYSQDDVRGAMVDVFLARLITNQGLPDGTRRALFSKLAIAQTARPQLAPGVPSFARGCMATVFVLFTVGALLAATVVKDLLL